MTSLRCQMCSVMFESKDTLAMHMLEHSFQTEDNSVGVRNVTRPNLLVAALSLNLYPDNTVQRSSRSTATIQCQLCHRVFGDQDTLAMHTLSHTNTTEFKRSTKSESHPCAHCGMVFSYQDMLLLHTITHHKQVEKSPLDLRTSSNYNRSLSSAEAEVYQLPDSRSLYRQLLNDITADAHKPEPTEPATKRRRTTESAEEMRSAIKEETSRIDTKIKTEVKEGQINNMTSTSHSFPTDTLDSRQGFYSCVHCNIIFLDRAMFHLHAGLHNHNSPFQCNICGKKCSSSLEFAAHVIHT